MSKTESLKEFKKYNRTAMLDLEFLCTEEDILNNSEWRGSLETPLVTSIGLTIQDDDTKEILYSKNFPLSIPTQLDNGAKIGKRCMVDFWTKQPNLGDELSKGFSTNVNLNNTILTVIEVLAFYKIDVKNFRLVGNNLMADNNKLMNLCQLYLNPRIGYPIAYNENFDMQGLKRTAEFIGIDTNALGKRFDDEVIAGRNEYFSEVNLHNAEYDCHRQLFVLNAIEYCLANTVRPFVLETL